MYTGYVSDMNEVGYYLDQADMDLEEVRAKLAPLIDIGYIDVDPIDAFKNANIIIVTRTDWVSKEEIEQLLGMPVIDEEDLEFTEEYACLDGIQVNQNEPVSVSS